MMKKFLALVLAMLMAISCVFAAFAEDEQTEAAAVEIVAQQAAEEIAAEPIELPAPAEEAPAAEPAPAEEAAPVAAEEQSEVVEAEPEAVEAVDTEPEAVETEPAATEPETTEAEPEAVETEPEVIEAETEPETLESEPVTEEPAAEAEQPVAEEPAAEEPEAVEAEPEVVESEAAETETESVEPEATEPVAEEPVEAEPVAEEPAEAETEVAPVAFEANFSAYLVNREQIVVGDAVYLFAVVTDANMAYTLTWETLRYVVPEGEEAALPTWQPLVVADNYSFFATMADNGSVYRAVLTAEDGTVIISGEITVTVVESEEPAETEAPAEDNIIEETTEPTEEPVEETTEPAEEPAVEETTEPAEEPVEETTEPTEEPAEEIAEPAEEPVEETTEPAEEPVEETTEPDEEPAEEIAEPAEEPAEEIAEPTEEPAEEITEPAEEPAEEIAEPIETPAVQPIAQADVEVVIIDDYETPLGLLDGEYETEPVEANIVDAEDEILYTWQRAEDGSLILDEDGNPIVTVYGDAEVPVAYQRDENGALILDENGNPIPAYTVPQDSVKVTTLEDALDPNRSIDIYISWNGETPALGVTATFIAVLHGYDNLIYTVQWQQSDDAAEWYYVGQPQTNEEGSFRLDVEITWDNYDDYWRVEVVITDYVEP